MCAFGALAQELQQESCSPCVVVCDVLVESLGRQPQREQRFGIQVGCDVRKRLCRDAEQLPKRVVADVLKLEMRAMLVRSGLCSVEAKSKF